MSRVDTARENLAEARREVIYWESGWAAALLRRDRCETELYNAEAEDEG